MPFKRDICHGLELPNSSHDHADFMRNPMTFDAHRGGQTYCRSNAGRTRPKDQRCPAPQTVVVKDTKDLELADEDRIFLLQVGIKP